MGYITCRQLTSGLSIAEVNAKNIAASPCHAYLRVRTDCVPSLLPELPLTIKIPLYFEVCN